jgi:hypothetical protein
MTSHCHFCGKYLLKENKKAPQLFFIKKSGAATGRQTDMTDRIENPQQFYKTPEDVLADKSLSSAQKDKILRAWEQDELALIRAEEENMISKTESLLPVDTLLEIKHAEQTLEEGKSA